MTILEGNMILAQNDERFTITTFSKPDLFIAKEKDTGKEYRPNELHYHHLISWLWMIVNQIEKQNYNVVISRYGVKIIQIPLEIVVCENYDYKHKTEYVGIHKVMILWKTLIQFYTQDKKKV